MNEAKWKLGVDLSENDSLLDGMTISELITTVRCNCSAITPSAVRKCLKDAWSLVCKICTSSWRTTWTKSSWQRRKEGTDMMVNVTLQPSWEQISFFVQERTGIPAKSLFDGSEHDAFAPSEFMKRLVPEGKYVVMIGSHPLVLRPTELKAHEVPEGHQFYHFEIENTIYSGVFVGEES